MHSILIGDPTPDLENRRYATLEAEGFVVRICLTGRDLLGKFAKTPADLVILDIDLSDMPSLTLCKELRLRPESSRMPILITAENGREGTVIDLLCNGADEYLPRPHNDSDLLDKVHETIEKTLVRTRISDHDYPDKKLFAGAFELGDIIDTGSYATVYQAVDRSGKNKVQSVAAKIFRKDVFRDMTTSANAQFLREAYEMSKLNHPHLVKLYDFGKYDASFYLIMEYFKGKSLSKLVTSRGSFSESVLISMTSQMLSVFEYLDRHRVVHRDIKPANLMIDDAGFVKVTDFGLAKNQGDSTLTLLHKHFMGTPNYASPEQIRGEKDVDIRCDIYSLGATLFYCATKKQPFDAESELETLHKNLSEPLPPIQSIAPSISKEFSEMVQAMMGKNPDSRLTLSQFKHVVNKLAGKS